MGIPLWVNYCFSLAAFNICSLCFIFINLINMCLGGVSPWIYPVWDSLGFLELSEYFLPHFKEVFNYYLLKYFLMAFPFVFFFWEPYNANVGAFDIVSEVSVVSSFRLILFSSLLHLFLPFYLPPNLSYLLPQLCYCWFPPELFEVTLLPNFIPAHFQASVLH